MSTFAYRYGCKPPTAHAEKVATQIQLARMYKNKRIELELARRAAVEAAVKSMDFTGLKTAEADVASLESALESMKKDAGRKNSEARSREASREDHGKILEIRKQLSSARARRKEHRKAIWSDPALKEKLAVIDAAAHAQELLARADFSKTKGLYWGTYLIIEEAAKDIRKGSPPKFKRWDGSGSIAVQCQGGLTPEDFSAGNGTLAKLSPDKKTLSIRVGKDADRDPIFAEFPISIHREIPTDANIMGIRVKRRKIGTQMEWTASATLRGNRPVRTPVATTGSVGIDLGWRLVTSGLRVSTWIGSDGRQDELSLPQDLLARWPKSESIQSIRDGNFNAARHTLILSLSSLILPEWMEEENKTMALWKSPQRLGRLWWKWKDARFNGDSPTFEALREWRKQDRHLWNWAESNVVKATRHRKNIYLNFAAKIASMYSLAYVEDTDWADINKSTEVDEDENGGVRKNWRVAAVGELCECLRQKMVVREVPALNTSRECSKCGVVAAFDASKIFRTCQSCGTSADQDYNASEIILKRGMAASGEMVKQRASTTRTNGEAMGCENKTDEISAMPLVTIGTARGGRFGIRRNKDLLSNG